MNEKNAAVTWEGIEAKEFDYRVCPATGLLVDTKAEKLVIANAVAAVICLTLGGIFALLISLTRWQTIHLLDATWYYRLTTAHGVDMLVAWIVFFEIAALYFGSTALLNARMVSPKTAWLAFVLMVIGGGLANFAILTGKADVMFTAYVPLKASPIFYVGVILFAVGALIGVGLFFVNVFVAKAEGRYTGSLPLVVYGLVAAAIIAVYTLLSGALAFVPALFWSLGLLKQYDPAFYRNLFWSFGHPAQQINLCAMVVVWYMLSHITTGGKTPNEKLSRFAFILYVLFINLGSAHHLLVDPGPSFPWKVFNTSYAMYLAVLASMIHAYSIPAGVEIAQRKKGFTKGLFGWLKNAPWKEPGFASLAVSIVIFGWIGGVTGVTIGTEQINMLAHNTLRVPGHFHATVVGGTTLAFMGLTYYLIPLVFRKELRMKKLATLQVYSFGAGMTLVSIGMIIAGLQGVSRRHFDITFANAAIQGGIPQGVHIGLALLGIGAIIAILAGTLFVTIVLVSILNPKKVSPTSVTLVIPQESVNVPETKKEPSAKGTFVLVLIFLMFFATYYLSNWWLLGRTWFIR